MRIIIAGSRGFTDYDMLEHKMNSITQHADEITVISGTARGADCLGEKWARDSGVGLERYPADWDKYGKPAGYIRNTAMARVATHLVAFWDGRSRGTKHMIDIARTLGLDVEIVGF